MKIDTVIVTKGEERARINATDLDAWQADGWNVPGPAETQPIETQEGETMAKGKGKGGKRC